MKYLLMGVACLTALCTYAQKNETEKEDLLETVLFTANRDAVKRSKAPLAISTLSAKTIREVKATTIDQLVNRTSGVYMVNLGNEQHSMGIRQPLGTRSLFLYLEDGIPVRTSGVFNHNALMEMNMAAVQHMEIIKGPGSSLFGGEAIGGVINLITLAPTEKPLLRVSTQMNNIGYRRADLQAAGTAGKWGFGLSGYHAQRKNGFVEYTDFNKSILTGRIDYRFSARTRLENSVTWMHYYSNMTGGIDSAMFARKTFSSQHTFTFRGADTWRTRTSLIHEWNDMSKTTASLVYRFNSLDQNPSYRVRDDYRRVGPVWVGKKDVAHGEINNNSFSSYVLNLVHRQKFSWKDAVLIGGATYDYSPNTAVAHYIKIKKDTLANKYVSYQDRPDSLLVDYTTNISNFAAFLNAEFSPIQKLRVVAALRYDRFHYDYDNHLKVSATSGAPDTANQFSKFSPKLGLIYQLGNKSNLYVNYSEGFVPPQVSELYRGVKVPSLEPSTFINYEIGGITQFWNDKLSVEVSAYYMKGKNSIISVRFDDGTFGNANAGATSHKGIELGIQAQLMSSLQFRINGAYSMHKFEDYIEKGVSYNGNQMNNAPNWLHNMELSWKPRFLPGYRMAVEWQKMSQYFMEPTNTFRYQGFDVCNLRMGYAYKGAEIWLNVINLFDAYYAVNSSKSSFGYSYTVGEPRNFNIGLSYDLGTLFSANKKK